MIYSKFRFNILLLIGVFHLIFYKSYSQQLKIDPVTYEVNVGSSLQFQLYKSSEVNIPTLYQMRTAPADAFLDENTGNFTWTPGLDDVGIRGIIFHLTDTTGAILAEEIVTVQVKKQNFPPVISVNSVFINGQAVEQSGNSVSIREKDKIHITASVEDENPGRLFFSHYFNGDVNQRELKNSSVHYNASTQQIDFKFQPGEEQAKDGFINWSINAVDEYGSTGNLNLRMDIKDVDFPPVILNKPSRKNIKDDFTFVYQPQIENDDSDKLIYSFEHDDGISNINLDDNSGRLTWEIDSKEMKDDKVYRIKYVVAEAYHPEHKDEVVLEVAWSETNKSPKIKAIPSWSVKEGLKQTYKIIAEDPNLDDELEFSLAGGFTLEGLEIDQQTGVLTFMPSYELVTAGQGAIDIQVAFNVKDKKGETTTGQIPVKVYDRPNPDILKSKLDNLQSQMSLMMSKTQDIKNRAEFVDSKLRSRRRATTVALSAVSLAGAIFAGLPAHTVLSKVAPAVVGVPAAYGLVNNLNNKEENLVDKLRRQSNDLYTIINHKKQVLNRYEGVSHQQLSNDPEFIALINQYNKEEELLELNSRLNEIKSTYELLINQKRYKRIINNYENNKRKKRFNIFR
ncbi:MAG: hypothetical protein ACNS60_08480 [Candidatus Cyclobacteriaceae bacterium M2_1C_046]